MAEGFEMDDFNPQVEVNAQDDEEKTALNDLEWDGFNQSTTYEQQSLTEQAAKLSDCSTQEDQGDKRRCC